MNSGVTSVVLAVAVASVWLSVPSAVPPKKVPEPSNPAALSDLRVALELVAAAVVSAAVTVTVHVADGVAETAAAPPLLARLKIETV